MKLLLLDLDNTIREPKSGAKFINKPDDQKLIDGVEDAIAHYKDWTIVGITNQGGVAAGHKSLEDAIAEQQYTLELLFQMVCILFCPDYEGKDCWVIQRDYREPFVISKLGENFRKPGDGMLKYAKHWAWNYCGGYATDPIEDILMVGDRPEDEQAALAASIPFMWAEEWRCAAKI